MFWALGIVQYLRIYSIATGDHSPPAWHPSTVVLAQQGSVRFNLRVEASAPLPLTILLYYLSMHSRVIYRPFWNKFKVISPDIRVASNYWDINNNWNKCNILIMPTIFCTQPYSLFLCSGSGVPPRPNRSQRFRGNRRSIQPPHVSMI